MRRLILAVLVLLLLATPVSANGQQEIPIYYEGDRELSPIDEHETLVEIPQRRCGEYFFLYARGRSRETVLTAWYSVNIKPGEIEDVDTVVVIFDFTPERYDVVIDDDVVVPTATWYFPDNVMDMDLARVILTMSQDEYSRASPCVPEAKISVR